MTSAAGTSHVGSMFSIADIVAVLCGGALRVDPSNPEWPDRDRSVLSKGHAGAAVYAALAERGFFERERLDSYCKNGSMLSGHLSHSQVAGVEFSTGSLGHGLGVACGFAYAGRIAKRKCRYVVLLSDGECDEGSNWEAIFFAGHHRLGALLAIVDYNKIQSLASVEETLNLEPFADKWRAFGWDVDEVDGHDHKALRAVFAMPASSVGKPRCVIAQTTKGKGVPFMGKFRYCGIIGPLAGRSWSRRSPHSRLTPTYERSFCCSPPPTGENRQEDFRDHRRFGLRCLDKIQ